MTQTLHPEVERVTARVAKRSHAVEWAARELAEPPAFVRALATNAEAGASAMLGAAGL